MPPPVVKTSDGLVEKICQTLEPIKTDGEESAGGQLPAPGGPLGISGHKGMWCFQFNYEHPEKLKMVVTIEAMIPLPIQIQFYSEMDYFLVEKLKAWLAGIPLKKDDGKAAEF